MITIWILIAWLSVGIGVTFAQEEPKDIELGTKIILYLISVVFWPITLIIQKR